jgi:chemotaxis protein MotB
MIHRRRRADHGGGHQERWLVSYADFVTLLLAFFVTMYAISTVDVKKMERAATALQDAFPDWTGGAHGVLPGSRAAAAGPAALPKGESELLNVESRLFYRLRAIGDDRVELTRDHRGLVITVRESGSFPVGSADLSDYARSLFGEIGRSLADLPNSVRIEGHTDDVPIHNGRFSSNWELSTARATAVVAFLVERVGMAPDRLSAAGYGEFHPRVANDSTDHRARNRRVDIVVLNAKTENTEEPLVGLDRR